MRATPASTAGGWADSLLAWRIRLGSGAALARLYSKHRHTLLKVATGLLASAGEAEDVVQDLFLSLARAPEQLRASGHVRAFLCTCVANRARNHNRNERRHEPSPGADPDALPHPSAGAARWVVVSEELAAVNRALLALPAEQREVLVLHLQGGLRFREIAASAGVSIHTVQSRYRYGLERLRSQLGEEHDAR